MTHEITQLEQKIGKISGLTASFGIGYTNTQTRFFDNFADAEKFVQSGIAGSSGTGSITANTASWNTFAIRYYAGASAPKCFKNTNWRYYIEGQFVGGL